MLAVLALGFTLPASARELNYKWFLRHVTDLDRLPYLEDGVVSRQFSSYHRASRYNRETGQCEGMDVNGDAGHRLSVHFGPDARKELEAFAIPADTPRYEFGDLQWVLDPLERNHVFFLPRPGVESPQTSPPEGIVATIGGPGCIFRIWSADPRGKIRFYLDGSTTPLEFEFKELFTLGASEPDAAAIAALRQWPFVRPLVFRRQGDADTLASDCYVPIPFARSCIVTLTQPSFYHVGYHQYPAGTQVQPFHLPLTAGETSTLRRVRRALLSRGEDPRGDVSGRQTIEDTVELRPGEPVTLADLSGPGIVQALHAKLQGNERYAGSKVLLTAHFDDEPAPCIWSPIVNFFGTGFEPRDYKSYPLGFVGGEGYCYYPMPFTKTARFVVTNEGTKPATLSYRIDHLAVDRLPDNTMHFKAKYRREQVSSTFDYPFLEAEGAGRFLGASLCIDDAWRSWWGEGDEKIYVDGETFPSTFGTGSEDYYGYAWGSSELYTHAYHNQTCCDGPGTYGNNSENRFHILDDIPFTRSFKFDMENWHSKEGITVTRAAVSYWYARPGGKDFFKPITKEDVRYTEVPPYVTSVIPGLIEGESLFRHVVRKTAGDVNVQELGEPYSGDRQLRWQAKKVGDRLVLAFESKTAGPKQVLARFKNAFDFAIVQVSINGQKAGEPLDCYSKETTISQEIDLGSFELKAGQNEFTLEIAGVNPAAKPKLLVGLDYIRLK